MTQITDNEIFPNFTDHQKDYIKEKLPSLFNEALLKAYFGDIWELELLGVCTYCRLKTSVGTLLLEMIKVDMVMHVRMSIDGTLIPHPSLDELECKMEAMGSSMAEAQTSRISIAFIETHIEPLFKTKWH